MFVACLLTESSRCFFAARALRYDASCDSLKIEAVRDRMLAHLGLHALFEDVRKHAEETVEGKRGSGFSCADAGCRGVQIGGGSHAQL